MAKVDARRGHPFYEAIQTRPAQAVRAYANTDEDHCEAFRALRITSSGFAPRVVRTPISGTLAGISKHAVNADAARSKAIRSKMPNKSKRKRCCRDTR
jgi:hypothetical protein